jgi:hypothetical protein
MAWYIIINSGPSPSESPLILQLISLFFPYLKKNKSRLMWSPCCLCVSVSLPINFWMPERIFMKLGMYIMAPEPISTAYSISPSHQSVSICVAQQGLGKNVTAVMNTQATIERLLTTSFSALFISYQRKVGDQFFQNFVFLFTFHIYQFLTPMAVSVPFAVITSRS